ncbi:hypothetical protein PpBr36_01802 [Pyricularia pennisetigena]|uniref:hypothetical protein n=1 Tax=Pyricularia pennisetigena TaxID=1578925 RepID=UPI00114DA8CD|nr:hypothetical protein PpBr36_01802 [Pyricularia pennisetigena]TLS28759.1 hypothetical protein PpBr36_01802 [Pyricularia pennisetigena]
MNLYATGFNAWNQLCFHSLEDQQQQQPGDLYKLTHALSDKKIEAVEPYLTYTYVETCSGVKTAGAVPQEHVTFREQFGRFALAANNSVIALVDTTHLSQYNSIYSALSGTSPTRTHEFVGYIDKFVAYDVGFAVLTNAGEVWTWGDERYPGCLGRVVSAESPASLPGRVTDLEELPTGKIIKIAAGGYTLAAITGGHDLYCWGGHPGRKQIIEGVSPSLGPVPVVVQDDSDVVDVAVGDSHAIVLTNKGEVFVTGENANGQLGVVDSPAQSNGAWIKVNLNLENEAPVGVAASPRASFITTKLS